VLFTNIWVGFAPASDEEGRGVKDKLITPNAHGVVLDVGAGKIGFFRFWCDKLFINGYLFRLWAYDEIP
jgi:hypothetical protein